MRIVNNRVADWKTLAALAETYKTSNCIFRGVEDESYELIPRIGRPDASKDWKSGLSLAYSEEQEKLCIDRFKREGRPHMPIAPGSDLDWLSIAQHYGLPTRLLDWTESPLVAAYFALYAGGFPNGRDPKNAAIYGVERPEVVETLSALSGDVVAYFPQHLTPRITAQQGLFTYHKFPNRVYNPSGLMKWIVPSEMCFTLKLILNKCGYNAASMFPDLGGVATHVRWLFRWQLL